MKFEKDFAFLPSLYFVDCSRVIVMGIPFGMADIDFRAVFIEVPGFDCVVAAARR